jgi:hypothetical protein
MNGELGIGEEPGMSEKRTELIDLYFALTKMPTRPYPAK